MTSLKWLKWVRELQAIAQTGLEFSKNPYDNDRYNQIMELATQIASEHLEIKHSDILEIFQNEQGYATPKIDVRGAVFRDNKILLVKEEADKKWSLPGGFADVNLSPSQNIIKEIEEEAGFKTKILKLISLEDNSLHNKPENYFHIYKCFFLCEIVSGDIRFSIETIDVDFFLLNNLPELSEARVVESQIKRCYEHYKNRDLPTDFD